MELGTKAFTVWSPSFTEVTIILHVHILCDNLSVFNKSYSAQKSVAYQKCIESVKQKRTVYGKSE